jgi:acetylornithine deacetylase/succinyl-diaminopimelate desuccinylase-like protein
MTAAQWLSRLVRIPSVSPAQAGPNADVAGEARLAGMLAEWFAGFGGRVVVDEVAPDRPNVYAIWQGRSQRWIAVDIHTDTVGVGQMTADPFSGAIRDGRVHGRGAVDTKATLAVVLELLETMCRNRQLPAANLLVAATVDEEHGATGAPAFARWLGQNQIVLDELIVAEPTLCTAVHGHKGVLRMRFDVRGVSAHSANPQLGRNAITATSPVVWAFAREHETLAARTANNALGPASLTVALIRGGSGINVVPDHCRISIDRRLVGGEEPDTVRSNLEFVAAHSCPLPVEASVDIALKAFFRSSDTPWVRRLIDWTGRPAGIAPYCTNAWAYDEVARQCVVLGPGSIEQAHGAEEWVEIDQLEKLALLYRRWWELE